MPPGCWQPETDPTAHDRRSSAAPLRYLKGAPVPSEAEGTPGRFFAALGSRFQYLKGAIKSEDRLLLVEGYEGFQYLKGAIKSLLEYAIQPA